MGGYVNPITGGLGWVASKILGAAGDVAMAPLNAIAKGVADAVTTLLELMATAWIRIKIPNVWTGETSGVVAALNNEVAYLAGMLAVFGIIFSAGKLALTQRGDAGFDIVHGLLVLVLVTGLGVPTIGLLTSGSDAWAQSIISGAGDGTDFGHNLILLVSPTGTLAPVLVVLFGIVAMVLSIAQVMLIAFRAAALVMMAGLIPVSAGLSVTPGGQQQLRKLIAWIIALVAYKPLAALIYRTAFQLIGTPDLSIGNGVGNVLIGLTMMTIAVLALPALVRLLVPAVQAAHTDRSAVRTVATALPSGARTVRKVI
jgi:type IV secretion system protein TrbL